MSRLSTVESINSLPGLLAHPTYATLVKIEAMIDTADPTFTNGLMRRSPYHMIQFLIFWATLADSELENALSKLNVLLGKHGISHLEKNTLYELIQSIDWASILQQAKTLQLTFEVPSREKMLSTLTARYPSLGAELSKSNVVGSVGDDWVVGVSTFQQNATWIKPFEEVMLRGSRVWEIPAGGFTLTDDLSRLITHRCAHPTADVLSENIGFLNIQYGTPNGAVKVYIAMSETADEFSVKQPKTRIHSGIYTVFNNLVLDLRELPLPVKEIEVQIEGEASFGQKGAHVKQRQTVGMFLGGAANPEYGTPTIIVVRHIEALFPQAGVPVSFYGKLEPYPIPEKIKGMLGIRVLAKEGADVVLLPNRLLPLDVASAILAAASAKPYQPADTCAAGLQCEGMQYLRYPVKDSMAYYQSVVSARVPYKDVNTTRCEEIFIGNIPRFLSLEYIAWSVEQLILRSSFALDDANSVAHSVLWVLQTQSNGCAKVWLPEGAFQAVNPKESKNSNPRLFFDMQGVWIATTPTALAKMQEYENFLKKNPSEKDSRLVASGMVLETMQKPVIRNMSAGVAPTPTMVVPGSTAANRFGFLPGQGVGLPQNHSAGEQFQPGTKASFPGRMFN